MRKRVIAPVVLVAALWIFVSVATTGYIHWLFESQEHALEQNMRVTRTIGAMHVVLWRIHAEM